MLRRIILPALLICASTVAGAQSTIRVMQYNLLNFPEPNPPGKADTLRNILDFHPVDLLICEEIRTEIGANMVLDQTLNAGGETRFSMAEWEPMHSDPGADYFLQQIIYYDHNKLKLKEQGYLTTYLRDLNWYTLYVNADDLALTHDTVFLTVFAVHLKAGSDTWDADGRADMAQVLVDFLPTLPADRHVLVAGDMNLYSGFEEACQTLIDDANAINLEDPINTIGGWSGNSFYAPVHTQSTRINTIYSDGAGGGLDDRFDLVFLSEGLMSPSSTLHYATGTYHPLGNSGDCFNQNVLDCNTSVTPADVLRSLYYMSDHLPVVLDLTFDGAVGLAETPFRGPELLIVQDDDGWSVIINTDRSVKGELRVMDPLGRMLFTRNIAAGAGRTIVALDANASGPCIISFASDSGTRTVKALLTRPR